MATGTWSKTPRSSRSSGARSSGGCPARPTTTLESDTEQSSTRILPRDQLLMGVHFILCTQGQTRQERTGLPPVGTPPYLPRASTPDPISSSMLRTAFLRLPRGSHPRSIATGALLLVLSPLPAPVVSPQQPPAAPAAAPAAARAPNRLGRIPI